MEGSEKDALIRDGQLARNLLTPGNDWIHRRVQSIVRPDPDVMKIRVSVDFTVPSDYKGTMVPITVLPKWPPLVQFDFTDDQGRSIPLLTSEQNNVADQALFEALIRAWSPDSLNSTEFKDAMGELVNSENRRSVDAFEVFSEKLVRVEDVDRTEFMVEMAATLGGLTLLWVPTSRAKPGVRTICHFEYPKWFEEKSGWFRRVTRSLGWPQPLEFIPLDHMGKEANFHLNIEVPPMLKIRSAKPTFYQVVPNTDDTDPATSEGYFVGSPKKRIGQFYISRSRPMIADYLVRIQVRRGKVVLPAFFAAVLIALLVSAFKYWQCWLSSSGKLDPSVAILILVPALISVVVTWQLRDAFIRKNALGVQVISMVSGLIPVVMAIFLLRFDTNADHLETAWYWSTIASWSMVAVLAVSLIALTFGESVSLADGPSSGTSFHAGKSSGIV